MKKKYPIYHLSFPNYYLMCATMARFQEHYESPRLNGKVFDFETFADAYAKKHDDIFSYYDDWAGYNFPSTVLKPFFAGAFSPLSRKEKAVLKGFRGLRGRFYVIASTKKDKDSIAHEMVHALFWLNRKYRREVVDYLEKQPLKRVRRRLEKKLNYAPKVHLDEINAYVLTGLVDDLKGLGLKKHRRKLLKLFVRHFDVSPRTKKGMRKLLKRIHRWKFKRKKRQK
ncbi:ABC transporter ATP-binding protein [Candidatus Uhrbacteria bacterium]|nr:ABC transporter ATP-binding protein [Candidatus Uhrbacteria bacterium]